MDAAILSVGAELLGTDRLDSNSLEVTELLWRFGVAVRRKVVVGDAADAIAAEVSRALEDVDLVVLGGGLGPTTDDVTREGVALALGRSLRRDPGLLRGLEERFAGFGLAMPPVNRRQADVIEGARSLANSRGTAPGMHVQHAGRHLFLFPGVPGELRGMLAEHLEPWLRARHGGEAVETLVLKIAMLPESEVEQRILPAYEEFGREAISILASPGDVRLRLTARGGTAQRAELLGRLRERLVELVGTAVYSSDGEVALEEVVGRLLAARGLTVATAESCTGGLIAERLTRVAGSSRYFVGAEIVYADRAKVDRLGLSPELFARHGAVSREVAEAMARAVRVVLGVDVGIAVTGIAGPEGGSAEKPVGTVWLALAGAGEDDPQSRLLKLPGDRQRIRWLASQAALEMLRRRNRTVIIDARTDTRITASGIC